MNHLLIIGFIWPEPNSTAAGSRMMQLIDLFLAQNWKITFASAASDSEHMVNLREYDISIARIKINDPSFDNFIKNLRPQAVMFDRFMTEEQFGWRVTKHSPDTIKILNTEDLHCLRKTRHQALKNNIPFDTSQLISQDITKREIASIYRCDLSLMISDFEIDLLIKTFNINKELLLHLPFILNPITSETKNNWPSYEDREHFITIGNFRHDPNWDSIKYLKEVIWPQIKKELPKSELHIYGAYSSVKATQLNNSKEGFYIKGRATNAYDVVKNARVCLAPLRFGAGIKGKLAEAMLCGTPSITTSIGAEGMLDDDQDWNGFIKNDPIAFANAATRLYEDKNIWSQSQQNGIEIVNTRFQKEKFAMIFTQKVDHLLLNLTKHRSKNFIGSMLQHHTLRSTEFMSRWIEEKNKKNL